MIFSDTDCSNITCPKHHTCTVMDKRVRCDLGCQPGFLLMNSTCVDVDECQDEGNECHASGMECLNKEGSYECKKQNDEIKQTTEESADFTDAPTGDESDECPNGFAMQDGKCEDVDECATEPRMCLPDELCVNVKGSHNCVQVKCEAGMRVSGNGTCVPNDSCLNGYEFDDFRGDCVDIDECKRNETACPPDKVCKNTDGSFECEKNPCEPGFHMVSGIFSSSCKDVDECSEKTHNCTKTQECVNMEGRFRCDCLHGYQMNDATRLCEDVDECLEALTCNSSISTCNNTMGSFDCVCKDGYEKSGTGSCTDTDECESNPCPQHARCTNKQGYHECNCRDGFVKQDNSTCVPDGKERACYGVKQSDGSCQCPEGFEEGITSEWIDCHDLNECKNQTYPCDAERSQECINTFGGFQCMDIACPENYVRVSNGKRWCRHEKLDERCIDEGVNCGKKFEGPATISYNYATVHNNLNTTEAVMLYTLNGLPDDFTIVDFDFFSNMTKLNSNNAYSNADYVRDFRVDFDRKKSRTTVELVKPLEGPQSIKIKIDVVAKSLGKEIGLIHTAFLNVYVSKYNATFNQASDEKVSDSKPKTRRDSTGS